MTQAQFGPFMEQLTDGQVARMAVNGAPFLGDGTAMTAGLIREHGAWESVAFGRYDPRVGTGHAVTPEGRTWVADATRAIDNNGGPLFVPADGVPQDLGVADDAHGLGIRNPTPPAVERPRETAPRLSGGL